MKTLKFEISMLTVSGVYGDVMRVKILYNKKDNALIQYSEPQQAQLGELMLNFEFSINNAKTLN